MPDHTIAALQWINGNPIAMSVFVQYARAAKAAGRKKIGIQMLIERTRWYGYVERPGLDFKIPNSYAATISRELMRLHPELDGFFTIAQERSKP